MVDLGTVTIADVYRCPAEIRRIGETGRSQDDVAQRIVSYLFEAFRSPATGDPECVLVRLFQT